MQIKTVNKHPNPVHSLDSIPGLLVQGLSDGTILANKQSIKKHNGSVLCVRFRPDHTQLVTTSDDTNIVLYNVVNNSLKFRKKIKRHKIDVVVVDYLGDFVVSGSLDGIVNFYDRELEFVESFDSFKIIKKFVDGKTRSSCDVSFNQSVNNNVVEDENERDNKNIDVNKDKKDKKNISSKGKNEDNNNIDINNGNKNDNNNTNDYPITTLSDNKSTVKIIKRKQTKSRLKKDDKNLLNYNDSLLSSESTTMRGLVITTNYIVTHNDNGVFFFDHKFRFVNYLVINFSGLLLECMFSRMTSADRITCIGLGFNNKVNTVEVIDDTNPVYSLVGHVAPIECVAFSPKKYSSHRIIAVASQDRSLSLWTTSKDTPFLLLKNIVTSPFLDLRWSCCGLFLYFCTYDGETKVIEFEKGELGEEELIPLYFECSKEKNAELNDVLNADYTDVGKSSELNEEDVKLKEKKGIIKIGEVKEKNNIKINELNESTKLSESNEKAKVSELKEKKNIKINELKDELNENTKLSALKRSVNIGELNEQTKLYELKEPKKMKDLNICNGKQIHMLGKKQEDYSQLGHKKRIKPTLIHGIDTELKLKENNTVPADHNEPVVYSDYKYSKKIGNYLINYGSSLLTITRNNECHFKLSTPLNNITSSTNYIAYCNHERIAVRDIDSLDYVLPEIAVSAVKIDIYEHLLLIATKTSFKVIDLKKKKIKCKDSIPLSSNSFLIRLDPKYFLILPPFFYDPRLSCWLHSAEDTDHYAAFCVYKHVGDVKRMKTCALKLLDSSHPNCIGVCVDLKNLGENEFVFDCVNELKKDVKRHEFIYEVERVLKYL